MLLPFVTLMQPMQQAAPPCESPRPAAPREIERAAGTSHMSGGSRAESTSVSVSVSVNVNVTLLGVIAEQ